MTPKQITTTSKFLSLVLRHQPETIDIRLDPHGWVSVDELLHGCARARRPLTHEQLQHIIATNPKKRFELSPDGTQIRASQGHSVAVDLDYVPSPPPEFLYHGTATQFLPKILSQGLDKRQRHDVHLSAETKVTLEVGARRGKPVLLQILAGNMHRSGHVFRQSTNGVWLVPHVPPEYIQVIDSHSIQRVVTL